ncbi:ribosomal RNA methyltransferase RrmJ/FtsJ [Desulfovibrio sp. X2]|uniref:SAM-dependent methyltransferase n=1 Tax=Desulfovibrio sp. X2 TaxID=941449 RepID=UPI000358D148|nr:SAM-dependent methyltransferase [Desulfovibrio sp. X2]EPR38687.1 ribosomal RNA methyltransferase RrmJ/FtsJ [Desulfovibrio sp. X2]
MSGPAPRLPEGPFAVYQTRPEYMDALAAELADLIAAESGDEAPSRPADFIRRGPLLLAEGPPRSPAWAQNVWRAPAAIPIESIADGAKKLKALQRNWHLVPLDHFRRAALIAEKLPRVAARPLVFGEPVPTAPLGSWTLWDEGTILASPECSSPFPDGEPSFVEDREGPPSRAYLKLWELLSILPERPGPGQLCLDLGGSPGGWAFVLASLGARVFCIDKAPLDPRVAADPLVESCQGSAFGLDPRHAGAVDWLFSDVICYPERLFQMVERWLELGECRRFACTVKLQGEMDAATLEILRKFRAVPGSRLIHLSQNKHELTWVKL